jgi:hypothetical protein
VTLNVADHNRSATERSHHLWAGSGGRVAEGKKAVVQGLVFCTRRRPEIA